MKTSARVSLVKVWEEFWELQIDIAGRHFENYIVNSLAHSAVWIGLRDRSSSNANEVIFTPIWWLHWILTFKSNMLTIVKLSFSYVWHTMLYLFQVCGGILGLIIRSMCQFHNETQVWSSNLKLAYWQSQKCYHFQFHYGAFIIGYK